MNPLMFRPDKKYLTKNYLEAFLIGLIALATFGWLGYLIGRSEFGISMGGPGLLLGLILSLLWILPTIVLINRYYHSLHYEIHEEEVIMHIGVVKKTAKSSVQGDRESNFPEWKALQEILDEIQKIRQLIEETP